MNEKVQLNLPGKIISNHLQLLHVFWRQLQSGKSIFCSPPLQKLFIADGSVSIAVQHLDGYLGLFIFQIIVLTWTRSCTLMILPLPSGAIVIPRGFFLEWVVDWVWWLLVFPSEWWSFPVTWLSIWLFSLPTSRDSVNPFSHDSHSRKQVNTVLSSLFTAMNRSPSTSSLVKSLNWERKRPEGWSEEWICERRKEISEREARCVSESP